MVHVGCGVDLSLTVLRTVRDALRITRALTEEFDPCPLGYVNGRLKAGEGLYQDPDLAVVG